VIAGVCDGLCDSRGVVGIGAGVRFGGLGVTGGSDRDSYHHRPSRPYQTSCFTIASDFHEYLFSVMHHIASCIVYSRVKAI
jgi:hypothetical protein